MTDGLSSIMKSIAGMNYCGKIYFKTFYTVNTCGDIGQYIFILDH